MTETDLSRTLRVRAYGAAIRDAGRVFRLAPGAELRAALRRAALAAIPKQEGWTTQVFTLERTSPEEKLAVLLDQLARREMGGDFAAGLAVSLDGATAVLVATARDPARIARLRAALAK
ncbi:hypothetical protein BKE38_25420 [Pseudoroseomonas deserti]|uniref:Uncharacterized protein n=1 Tax=Teichococcus deserti TaxID=1817963 RepID=A0A1V2GV53_9PROT|nr:hypothetical protein [Pseudoroseomonas deserti]ONG46387.1 hypothetical protein BKE38_25420 [Pseudoroseomonas deserti]